MAKPRKKYSKKHNKNYLLILLLFIGLLFIMVFVIYSGIETDYGFNKQTENEIIYIE